MLICEQCGLSFEVDREPVKSQKFRCDKKGCGVKFWAGDNGGGMVCGLDIRRCHGKPIRVPDAPAMKILRAVCDAFECEPDAIADPCRRADLYKARAAASLALRNYTGLSSSKIGMMVGGRDHSTILHAVQRAQDMLAEDSTFAKKYRQAEAQIVS